MENPSLCLCSIDGNHIYMDVYNHVGDRLLQS